MKVGFFTIVAIFAVVGLVVTSCGTKSEKDKTAPEATTSPNNNNAGNSKSLPAVYASNCQGCHGADGTTVVGSDAKLAGSSLSEAAFSATVRNGKGGMPPFAASVVTNAEISQIWGYFKK